MAHDVTEISRICAIIGDDVNAFPALTNAVKMHLRLRGEPITLFGESHFERRQRLKNCFDKPLLIPLHADTKHESKRFYQNASPEIVEMRELILGSEVIIDDAARQVFMKSLDDSPVPVWDIVDTYSYSKWPIRAICNPIPDIVVLGSLKHELAMLIKGENVSTLRTTGYTNHIITLQSSEIIASAHSDGTIAISSLTNDILSPRNLLSIHDSRVNRLAKTRHGNYIVSTSHDESIAYTDVNIGQCIYTQEGHESPVYAIDIDPSTSQIAATTDLHGFVKIWDLRCGTNIANAKAHPQQALDVNFHPLVPWNFLTSGNDGVIRIWDLRMMQCADGKPGDGCFVSSRTAVDTICRHTSSVNTARFEPKYGRMIYSYGSDGIFNGMCYPSGEQIIKKVFDPAMPAALVLIENRILFSLSTNSVVSSTIHYD